MVGRHSSEQQKCSWSRTPRAHTPYHVHEWREQTGSRQGLLPLKSASSYVWLPPRLHLLYFIKCHQWGTKYSNARDCEGAFLPWSPDSRESRAGPSWKEDPLWLPRTWMLEDGGEHGAQCSWGHEVAENVFARRLVFILVTFLSPWPKPT